MKDEIDDSGIPKSSPLSEKGSSTLSTWPRRLLVEKPFAWSLEKVSAIAALARKAFVRQGLRPPSARNSSRLARRLPRDEWPWILRPQSLCRLLHPLVLRRSGRGSRSDALLRSSSGASPQGPRTSAARIVPSLSSPRALSSSCSHPAVVRGFGRPLYPP